jgi:hypothetical protein
MADEEVVDVPTEEVAEEEVEVEMSVLDALKDVSLMKLCTPSVVADCVV